jgi:hypothetical protein
MSGRDSYIEFAAFCRGLPCLLVTYFADIKIPGENVEHKKAVGEAG